MIRTALGVAAAALLALLPAAPAAEPAGYGANDSGGFLNVLPPGQTGHITALQLAQNQTSYAPPPHFDDQRALYNDLLYASPTLTDADVPKYFKDATFGATLQQPSSKLDTQWRLEPRFDAGAALLR